MQPVDQRPDVILIHCHDLGRHLGCYGISSVVTPHLDSLARTGVMAEAMFAAAPQCSPSRAAMLTGRWPHANGVMGLTHRHFGWDLHEDEQHLARRLGRAGYRTELIGVMHEARRQSDALVADALGFDRVRQGGLCDEVAAAGAEAVDRLTGGPTPYFLQIGFVEPHRIPGSRDAPGVMGFLGDHLEPDDSRGVTVPGYLEDSPTAQAEIAELQGAIRALDAAVGRVLAAVAATDRADNTIVIFTTDHGLALPRAKCSLHDPGLEIAFLARWVAGGWSGGRQLRRCHVNIDIVPTILEALGLPSDDGKPLHGTSFARQLAGAAEESDEDQISYAEMTYHDYYDPRRSVRTQRHKLIVNFSSAPEFMDPSQSWARRCTPVESKNGNSGSHEPVELYDLSVDPLELVNLADDPGYAATRKSLQHRLLNWMAETADPLLEGAVTSPMHRSAMAILS